MYTNMRPGHMGTPNLSLDPQSIMDFKPRSQMPLRTLYEQFSDNGKTGIRTKLSFVQTFVTALDTLPLKGFGTSVR